jgi:hypothetical protein
VSEEGAEGGGVGGAFDAEVGVGEFEMEDAGGCWNGWGGLRGDDADGKERGGVAGLLELLAVAATPGEDQVGVAVVGAGDEGDGGAGGEGFLDDLAAEFGGPIGAGAGWGTGHEGVARGALVLLACRNRGGIARRPRPDAYDQGEAQYEEKYQQQKLKMAGVNRRV